MANRQDGFLNRPYAMRSDEGCVLSALLQGKAGHDLAQRVERAAREECAVLIRGETGTGKQLWAQWLHRRGPRCGRPFVPIRCATLTEALAEAQLFGHAEGMLAGARGSGLGRLQAARGGIVLLDEVSALPRAIQAKLAEALCHQRVTPVGATVPVAIEVQAVATTARDLAAEVKAGRFSASLYRQLTQVDLALPTLRQRTGDIPALVRLLSSHFAAKYQRPAWQPDADTLRSLGRYDWPGNVRQLSQVIERSYVLDCAVAVPG